MNRTFVPTWVASPWRSSMPFIPGNMRSSTTITGESSPAARSKKRKVSLASRAVSTV